MIDGHDDGRDEILSTVGRGETRVYEVKIAHSIPVTLRYKVELLEVPPLGPGPRLKEQARKPAWARVSCGHPAH